MPKISQYPDGGNIQSGDKLVIARSGQNYSILGSSVYSQWMQVTETWTRTGNHTFRVSTDLTSRYRKGTRVRYKDGGSNEYGVVYSSSYSAPNTTVTLITNSDYAMASATITDTYISYSENPEGFPHWFAYASEWTATGSNPSIGNGSYTAYWSAVGRTIFVKVEMFAGGTTNFGSGLYNFTIPVISAIRDSNNVAMESASGNFLFGGTRYAMSSFIRSGDMRGIYENSILSSTTVAWTSGNSIHLSGWYQY